MTALEWTAIAALPAQLRPSARWGHSCCVVGHDLYLFGGFANSNYLGDLWRYSLEERMWEEITATGDLPSPRSNATLNYDDVNRQLVLFGGGGPSKERFNCVCVLDLEKMDWVQLQPFENEPAPWERTYHSAEFSYPYLFVFGGEGVDDLGDLWLYNLQTLSWREIKMQGTIRPRPRRFHSSCIGGDNIYVFGGCEGKYNCLGDLYELDLRGFKESGNGEDLVWREVELGGNGLGRWGQSTHYFNGMIYVFGGRASEDLQDLLSIDPRTGEVVFISAQGAPRARRRHAGGFIGSCLVLFGGFDGNYFNDHFYINLHTPKAIPPPLTSAVNYSDHSVTSIGDSSFPINTSLVAKYFETEEDLGGFLEQIEGFYLHQELQEIFDTLISGFGHLPLLQTHRRWLTVTIPLQRPSSREVLSSLFKMDESMEMVGGSHVVEMESYQLAAYLRVVKEHWQYQHSFAFNSQLTQVCRGLLVSSSPFLRVLMDNGFKKEGICGIDRDSCGLFEFQLVLAFLHTGVLVLPSSESNSLLIKITELAEYLGIASLTLLCEKELALRVNSLNYQEMKQTSQSFDLAHLAEQCSMMQLNHLVAERRDLQLSVLSAEREEGLMDAKTKILFDLLKFDLVHSMKEGKATPMGGEGSENVSKENKDSKCPLLSKKSSRK